MHGTQKKKNWKQQERGSKMKDLKALYNRQTKPRGGCADYKLKVITGEKPNLNN